MAAWTLNELTVKYNTTQDTVKAWLTGLGIQATGNNDVNIPEYSIHPILLLSLEVACANPAMMDTCITLGQKLKTYAAKLLEKDDQLRVQTLDSEMWAMIAREYARRIATVSVKPYHEAMSAELEYMQRRYHSMKEWSFFGNTVTPPEII